MIALLRRPVIWLPISAALLALVAWRSRVWEATEVLGSPAPLPLLLAVLLNGVVVSLWAVRSANLLGATGHRVSRATLVPMTAFANTINNLTPGSAGEVVRAWLLRSRHEVPYATGTAVIVIERVVAFTYLGASALVAWGGHLLGLPAVVVAALLLLVATAPAIVYGAGLRPAASIGAMPLGSLFGPERWTRLRGALVRIDATVAALLTDPRHLAGFAITTALIFATYTAQLWLVAASLGVTLDPLATWGALGLATVAGVLSLLPFGLGATDAVLATLLVSMGVPGTAAGAITFGYRLIATLPLGVIGTASYGWLSARLPPGGTSAIIDAVAAGMAEDRPEAAG